MNGGQSPFAGVDLTGHRILIVGAASGIGRAAAGLIAARGGSVILADRDAAGAAEAAEKVPGATWVDFDVTSARQVERGVGEVLADERPLTALVNCAGITGRTGRLSHEIDEEDFDLVHRSNLRGAFLVTRAVLPHMTANGFGRILHVASIAGKEGNPGMMPYSSSKAGLIGMVKAMGKEYALTGVTINAIAPAVIRTQMVEAMPESQVAYMTERIPMARCGTLEEVSEAIAWVISPAASFTTGFVFDLSGGRAVY